MNIALVILLVLFITSTMLCITMTLAWLHFGRQRHALSWAIAYGCGALQWATNALTITYMQGRPAAVMLATLLFLTTSSLVAIGARQRAGLNPYYGLFLVAGAVAIAVVAMLVISWPHFGLRVVFTNLYIAAMMPIAILAVLPRKRKAQPPEIAFATMLVFMVLFQIVLGMTGFTIESSSDADGIARYRALLVLGLPPIHIGTGIAAVFLLAGDLAESVRALVTRDPLTGTLNRRGVEQAAIRAIANARRHGRALAVVMADIDRFKTINDRFGHAMGDRALTAFSDHVQASVREEDIFGRMGGDEFCLLLIDATADEAAEAIERTRQELEKMFVDDERAVSMTASFGITNFLPQDVGFGDLLHRADLALYDSKLAGRNRTTVVDRV